MSENLVLDLFKKDKDTLYFLLLSSINSIKSDRKSYIFNPKPETKISHILNELKTVDEYFVIFETCRNDREIIENVGVIIYNFFNFIIESNRTNMVSTNFETVRTIETKTSTGIKHDTFYYIDDQIITYSIKYPSEHEDKFNIPHQNFLFHGSSIENWHSILRNGIKNCSGTRLQRNGAVHGSGVYLTPNINLALSYCSSSVTAVGVIQILGDVEKWKKSGDIYVVSDESILLLRNIILLKKHPTSEQIENLNNYFKEGLTNLKKRSLQGLKKTSKKRLNVEIKKIRELEFLTEITEDSDELLIKLNFEESNIIELTLLLKIPHDYPLSPPKIAIKSPIVETSDIIGEKGSICLEELCNNKWRPSIIIKNICKKIYDNIIHNDLRKKRNGEYNFDEAISEFYEIQRQRGWH